MPNSPSWHQVCNGRGRCLVSGMRTDYTEGIEPFCVVVMRLCNDANFVANVVW